MTTVEQMKKMFPGIKVITLDAGDNVICDICNKDFTNSDKSGGFLFQSKAVCPDCEPEHLRAIEGYNEQRFIRGYCPKDMSFANWVRSIR